MNNFFLIVRFASLPEAAFLEEHYLSEIFLKCHIRCQNKLRNKPFATYSGETFVSTQLPVFHIAKDNIEYTKTDSEFMLHRSLLKMVILSC